MFDAALEGRWETDDDTLLIERTGDLYGVTMHSKKDPADSQKYEMHLVDLNGVRFADLLPEDMIGHMFLRVRLTVGLLRIDFFDSEWLRKQIPHEEADIDNGRKRAVLTARTPQLQSLVAKFARESKSYADENVFRRVN